MCAVCFNSLQVIPVAAVAGRALWVAGRNRGGDSADVVAVAEPADEPAAEPATV